MLLCVLSKLDINKNFINVYVQSITGSRESISSQMIVIFNRKESLNPVLQRSDHSRIYSCSKQNR